MSVDAGVAGDNRSLEDGSAVPACARRGAVGTPRDNVAVDSETVDSRSSPLFGKHLR